MCRGGIFIRQPNGFGSVHRLSGKRRKPWRVRKTKGWEIDEQTGQTRQIYITIGYYATRQEAIQALSDYNKDPYDISTHTTTFKEVYEKWSAEHFEEIVPSARRTWISAFKHSEPLWDYRMRDLRAEHLEQTIKAAKVGDDTKKRMKSLYNLMYKYALRHEIVDKDYAALCKPVKKKTPSKPKVPFTDEEMQLLWNNLDFAFVDMVLIGIYSGWRPQELATLKKSDIDLEAKTMFGGLKTEAGKNRYVPIHSKILPLIIKRYEKSDTMLFEDINSNNGIEMTYDKYRERFMNIMDYLGLKHKPHETRHTFITRAKEAGVDEYCLKLIVGHQIGDVTERVYTHRTVESLAAEIEKIG